MSADGSTISEPDNEVEVKNRWCKKVLDVEEAKTQFMLALPLILTHVFYFFIPSASLMFAGHLGELELAGSTLANSWATVTGYGFMSGLSCALETLCGQGYGAKLYGMMGIHLQASCIISCFFSIFIAISWFYSKSILILLHQDPHISEKAALYMKYLIPGLFAFGFMENILRFLQTQSVVKPLVVFSLLPLIIHIGITYSLVHKTSLAFRGAALAVSVSQWISLLVLVLYVLYAKKFKRTWEGFSLKSFHHIVINLKLALPSAAMVCLEYWAYELLVLLAGLMPNSKITTSLVAMCVNTEMVTYMTTYGLGAAASTRVSNELGAGNPNQAKHAMFVALKLSILLALAVILALALGHNTWAGFFSDSSVIVEEFATMTPLLIASVMLDSVQGVLLGVARGAGWQNSVALINLTMFIFIGMPIGGVLGFKLNLHVKGLWMGLICGIVSQNITLLLLTQYSKWTRVKLIELSSQENSVPDFPQTEP